MTDHVSRPTAGFYFYQKLLGRLPNGRADLGPPEPVLIAKIVTPDPWFPENEQQRSPVWTAYRNGQECDLYDVWPYVAGNKIDTEKYNELRGLNQ